MAFVLRNPEDFGFARWVTLGSFTGIGALLSCALAGLCGDQLDVGGCLGNSMIRVTLSAVRLPAVAVPPPILEAADIELLSRHSRPPASLRFTSIMARLPSGHQLPDRLSRLTTDA